MPFDATPHQVFLDTMLDTLAPHFLKAADGNHTLARDTARQLIADYNPGTERELGLVVEIVGLNLHALEALGQSIGGEIPLNHQIRLRNAAVRLSNACHRGEKLLEKLQQARAAGEPEPAEPAPPPSQAVQNAVALVQDTRAATDAAKDQPQLTWTQRYNQRCREKNLAKRAERERLNAEMELRRQQKAAARQQSWASPPPQRP